MARGMFRKGWSSGRARVAAWLGVVALLVQALLPAAAMAAASGAASGETVVVCTMDGVRTIVVNADEKGGEPFAGLPCHDCLAASVAALAAPEPQVEPVVYAHVVIERPRERSWTPSLARAPPRPPGQGPPTA